MSRVLIRGLGAVSPAGWDVTALRQALVRGNPLPTSDLARPGWDKPLRTRAVPAPVNRPAFLSHARLRRASPIAQYAVSAALEALGSDWTSRVSDASSPGIIFCSLSGCVNYSRRFYDETLKDPATASPLLFPETVFNAPASHLAALLGARTINYTLVGDPGTFLQGLALGADWLVTGRVDSCLVVAAEELDWLVSDAFYVFNREGVVSAGAGAVWLALAPDGSSGVELKTITEPHLFSKRQSRAQAARRAQQQLGPGPPGALLCDGLQGVARLDRDEAGAWRDWEGPRLSLKTICGEGFMAAAAWQCVAAVDALIHQKHAIANVSVVGCNQQAIAAQFIRSETNEGHSANPLS